MSRECRRRIDPFPEFIHPDDIERSMRAMSEGDRTARFDNRYRCKDGSYKWIGWLDSVNVTDSLAFVRAIDINHEYLHLITDRTNIAYIIDVAI